VIRFWVEDTLEADDVASLVPSQSPSQGFEAQVVEVCGLVVSPCGQENHLPWDSVEGTGLLSWVVEDFAARAG
jgi:hypothetical protein